MDNKIAILGAGESGVGAAILAKKEGYKVFVSDAGPIKDKYKLELDSHKIEWEELGHSSAKILQASTIIKSPGIPNDTPLLIKAIELNISIISEIEFASRYTNAKLICITGSNGKTTTTSLIYHILKEANLNVGLAGNIGFSLARQVAQEKHSHYVIELSSFQLDNMYKCKADIAIILNITPDHLDRYNYVFQNYVDAKLRITQNQTASDQLIYWNQDPILVEEINSRKSINATLYPFSLEKDESKNLTYIEGNKFCINGNQMSIELNFSKLKGKHNLLNTMAAITAAYLLGISAHDISNALESFLGVEHRLEYVKSINNVTYINDSKATNIDSCKYALEAINKNIILILGGKDKGNDYNLISPLIKKTCKALVFLGKDNSKLVDFFKDENIPYYSTDNIHDAVVTAADIALPKDTVLLSPCCASFDLFKSYEDRGELFKTEVNQL